MAVYRFKLQSLMLFTEAEKVTLSGGRQRPISIVPSEIGTPFAPSWERWSSDRHEKRIKKTPKGRLDNII
jgi:hypothetical protein